MKRPILSELLALQCKIFHIPFYLYQGTQRLEEYEPSPSPGDMISPWLPYLMSSSDSPNYLLTKDLLLFGRVLEESSGLQIIAGPTHVGKIMDVALRNIVLFGRPAIGVENIQEVGAFLNSSAGFSLEQFLPILCSLHGFLNETYVSPEELMVKETGYSSLPDIGLKMISATMEHTYMDSIRRNNFDLEAEMMFYVSHGMTKQLQNMQIPHRDMGTLAPESLRHYKNATIILNTLCQRAAIMGGLDPELSYQLGEIYIQRIEACKDMDALLRINVNNELTMDYCERVARLHHPKTNHPKINEAMHYVRENYQKRLTVSEVATKVGLSKEYLSVKFHEVTGMTLPEYINEQKITEAKQLLHFTDMTLSEIAEYLSFSSQSYFQTVFKKITDDTPMEYRLKNKISS